MGRLSPAQGHLTRADSKGWTLAPNQLKEVRGLHRTPGREEGKKGSFLSGSHRGGREMTRSSEQPVSALRLRSSLQSRANDSSHASPIGQVDDAIISTVYAQFLKQCPAHSRHSEHLPNELMSELMSERRSQAPLLAFPSRQPVSHVPDTVGSEAGGTMNCSKLSHPSGSEKTENRKGTGWGWNSAGMQPFSVSWKKR